MKTDYKILHQRQNITLSLRCHTSNEEQLSVKTQLEVSTKFAILKGTKSPSRTRTTSLSLTESDIALVHPLVKLSLG